MKKSDNYLSYKELVRMIRNLNSQISYLKGEKKRLEERVEYVTTERDEYAAHCADMEHQKDSRYDSLINALTDLLEAQKEEDSEEMPF